MAFQISMESIKQYEDRGVALRAINCFFPARYIYEVVETLYRLRGVPRMYSVKAYHKSGQFAGYCYDPESEQ